MQINGLFSNTLSFLEKSLDLRTRKQRVLASDIANADTPNYRAFDVMVEDALQKVHPSETDNDFKLVTTDRRHLSLDEAPFPEPVLRALPVKSYSLKTDGNTVDVDREMGSLAKNQIMYNASVEVINRELRRLKTVIQGGK